MKIESQLSTQVVIKKELSIRTVLNIVGIFIFLGLLLTILSIPLSLNSELEFYANEKIKMSSEKLKEFLIFITSAAVIYFFLANVFFMGKVWRKVFFTTLILITLLSFTMISIL